MSGENMERRIDMGEIPAGGVVPTEDQARRINLIVDTGINSYAGATMAILGVMPHRVYGQPSPDETPDPQEPVYDHSVRVAELTHAVRLDMGLGPKISKLAGSKGDEKSKLQLDIERTKRRRDQHMENGCTACPHQDDCEIKEKDWEDGMREVHPHLKPNRFGIVYETEPLTEMIKRIVPDPEAHCDDKLEHRLENPQVNGGEFSVIEGMYDDGDEEEKRIAANFDLRNIHLDKADEALGVRNRINRILKKKPRNEGRLAEESHASFEEFAGELDKACALCSHSANCALKSDPVAWAEAKHYAKSPGSEWEDQVNEAGVRYESREHWRKRRKQDPQAPCPPPTANNQDRPKPTPPAPVPDPGLPEAA